MSTPWAQTTLLSSAAILSTPIALDPLAKMTVVQLTFSSTAVSQADVFVQATLDTTAFSASGGIQPQPQPIWSAVGSSVGFVSVASTSTGSGIPAAGTGLNADNSVMFVLLQPVAGLRLTAGSSISIPSSAPLASGTVTLRALQSPAA